jgi:parallel beta-helix repeat protein
MQRLKPEKIITIAFGLVVLIASGILISLLVIPFTHPKVNTNFFRIYINSDEDFNNYNFPGSGTEEDPYIIENYTYFEDGLNQIQIFGVNKSFIIRNNIIYSNDWECGISLASVSSSNVIIIGNIIYGSAYRFSVEAGIRIYNLYNCSILNNSVYNVDVGIKLLASSNCLVENNSLINNGRNIEVRDCTNLPIVNNVLMVNMEKSRFSFSDSIHVEDSINISINSNECKNSGIWFSASSSSTITLQNNTVCGLHIGFFKNKIDLLFNNSEQYGQLFLVNCTNCITINLTITKSIIGLSFYNCSYCNCSSCNFDEDLESGLYISHSSNLIISEGEFSYNLFGARILYSDSIKFKNNLFQYNYYGVYVSNSVVVYDNNTFYNNINGDIRVYDY